MTPLTLHTNYYLSFWKRGDLRINFCWVLSPSQHHYIVPSLYNIQTNRTRHCYNGKNNVRSRVHINIKDKTYTRTYVVNCAARVTTSSYAVLSYAAIKSSIGKYWQRKAATHDKLHSVGTHIYSIRAQWVIFLWICVLHYNTFPSIYMCECDIFDFFDWLIF